MTNTNTLSTNKLILYILADHYQQSVNDLQQLRSRQGYKVKQYVINANDTHHDVKTFIEKTYTEELQYILLVGSTEEVPTVMRDGINETSAKSIYNQTVYSAASDISYGIINHQYTVVVGRLSPGDNVRHMDHSELSLPQKQTNVQTQVNKILFYEEQIDLIVNGNVGDLSNDGLRKIIGVASNEGGGYGIENMSDNVYMRQELQKFCNSSLACRMTELYQGTLAPVPDVPTDNEYDGFGDPLANRLTEELNQGSPLLLYTGHANEVALSTSKFDVNDVKTLTNTRDYFLGCVVGCSVGSHDEPYMSLSEYFQVATDTNGHPVGSIAMFASSILQSWKPPMHMQRGLIDGIINSTSLMTIGELFKDAVMCSQFCQSNDWWYYHILGDPATRYMLTLPQLRTTNDNPPANDNPQANDNPPASPPSHAIQQLADFAVMPASNYNYITNVVTYVVKNIGTADASGYKNTDYRILLEVTTDIDESNTVSHLPAGTPLHVNQHGCSGIYYAKKARSYNIVLDKNVEHKYSTFVSQFYICNTPTLKQNDTVSFKFTGEFEVDKTYLIAADDILCHPHNNGDTAELIDDRSVDSNNFFVFTYGKRSDIVNDVDDDTTSDQPTLNEVVDNVVEHVVDNVVDNVVD